MADQQSNQLSSEPEEWRPVVGFPAYEVSNLGRLRRVVGSATSSAGPRAERGTKGGYINACLSDGSGRKYQRGVHALVCEAFIGPRQKGIHVNHIDGNKKNNRLTNLEYVTPAENNRHANRTGLNPVECEDNPAAKLTNEQVIELRRRYSDEHKSLSELARAFGVSKTSVCDIVQGKNWQALGLPDIRRRTLAQDIVEFVNSASRPVKAEEVIEFLRTQPRKQDRGGNLDRVVHVLIGKAARSGEISRVKRGFYVKATRGKNP